jgi:hypothetical protein
MNRVMPSGIRSRIATAAAMGALAAAISALSAPALALAAPTPLHAYQANSTNIPTSLDGLRSAQLPLPLDQRGGSSSDDDDDNYYYDY